MGLLECYNLHTEGTAGLSNTWNTIAAMDISSEGSSSYVGLAPKWYSRIGGETAIGTKVTVKLNSIIGMASECSISIKGSPGDIGSILMSGNDDSEKSQGASGCAGVPQE